MRMIDAAFTTALQKATSGKLSLLELIDVASVLSQAHQPALARQLYKVWIGFNRDDPQRFIAHFNCSALESDAGEIEEAILSLKQAIVLKPDFTQAHINLGRMMERSGAPDQAIEIWRGIANRPTLITGDAVHFVTLAMKQMARVLTDHHQTESTEFVVQKCLEINPYQNDVIEQYIAARLSQCKWPVVVPSERIDRKTLLRAMHPLSVAIYTDDPLFQLSAAERYSRTANFEGPHDPSLDRRHAELAQGGRLRIGYVSSDLRDHAIGNLMVEVFELHNKNNVEVFAYYTGEPSRSNLTERTKSAVEHWRDISRISDDDVARIIANDSIDILVDINGHTRSARTGLFARRAAPIQVNWLGYPGSMGTPYHHYIIADDWIIPPADEIYYSEKVLRLPCYQPSDRKREIAQPGPTRAEAGLPDSAFVFCCFNGSQKISRFTFERWLQILARVPNSVLWLIDTPEGTKDRLHKHAQANGVAAERIIFAPRQGNAAHLARYPLADLFLDTAPYGAHTTASDALFMGVPVLTLSGHSFASR
ncbi:MAG: N-acetylglucosamine transferase, partial [Alphaproteobacteria bacterium]